MQKSLVEALQLAVDETDFTKVRFILSKVLSAMYNGQHLVDFSDGFPQGEAPQGEAPQGEAPQGEAPQGEAPQDETSQDETPQGE